MSDESPLLLLAPRITEDTKSMWKAALDLGWSVQRIPNWRVPEGIAANHRQISIYGEPLFAEAVADQLNLVLLEPSIDWLTTVPREYLHRDIQMMTLADARQCSDRAFVKPADGKIFDPKVYETGSDLPDQTLVDQDIPVLRSGPVDFRLEVRSFVHERKVIASSPYWRNNALAQDESGNWPYLSTEQDDAESFARTVLADSRISLPPACTLDIGHLSDGRWAIIEANPCWGAGLYGCDPGMILEILPAAVIRRTSLLPAHMPWVSARRTKP
ncbi:MAG TPA: ATP-grasp domain-containing protein [Prosthecobacter sp.]